MKLYFEGYSYPTDSLRRNLGNNITLSYCQGGNMAKVQYVGYYFNAKIKDTVFIMPKVFISEESGTPLAFGRYMPTEIIDLSSEKNPLKEKADDVVVFELSAWHYQAISHFFERKQQSNIGSDIQLQHVRPIGETDSKTIIEIILSLIAFQKKHHNLFIYMSLIQSSGNNKVHWAKTISKVQPVFRDKMPYYLEFRNKNKVINFDEELISLFYSVLNYLSLTYHFNFQPVQGYTLLRPSKISSLIEGGKGTRLLKKIRHNYFSDELVELWNLLYVFFNRSEDIASGKAHSEKLLVSNFNLVFEDMIDQLISDKHNDVPKELWEQPDGKIVDHIYKAQSIIEDNQQIYYIGDSKYYKESTNFSKNSIFKQFTYAKNVIQYNINLFNNKDNVRNCRYRDPLTEGYSITPNFFIRGVIDFDDPKSQEQKILKDQSVELHNEHFFNRLFDRDTLFLQSYNINFMFVVASYVQNADDISLKKSLQNMFRRDFMEFIEERFEFSVLEPKKGDLRTTLEKNFKKLNGKVYQPNDCNNLLILALDKKDEKIQFENLQLISEIEKDFHIYEYHLGNDPEEAGKAIPYQYWEIPQLMAADNNSKEKSQYPKGKTIEYKKYHKTSVLFGIFKNEAQKNWILREKKYNVRLGERAGAVKRTRQVISVQYLVLYDLHDETKYEVYKLSDKHEIWDEQKMKATNYPYPKDDDTKKQYYIYTLEGETDELEKVNVKATLEKKRQEFKANMGEELDEGTPIYVYEGEIVRGW